MQRADFDTAGDVMPRPHDNCYWLLAGRVLAGEYPAAHLPAIEAAGVTHFVDLTEAAGYRPQRAVHRLHPITDFGLPTQPGMRATLQTIAGALDDGGTVYLHCRAGIGRTGTVAGCLLVEQGFTADEALALLQRKFQAMAKSAWVGRTPETAAQRAFIAAWKPTLRSA
jgi:hypothetical protein